MEIYERRQALLQQVLERFCDGNKAELSRRLQKDASYINRLFYPQSKSGAKGIGQEIMETAKRAFPLPLGFWDMSPIDAFDPANQAIHPVGLMQASLAPNELIVQLAAMLRPLSPTRREAVKPVLAQLATRPEDGEEMASLFSSIIGRG